MTTFFKSRLYCKNITITSGLVEKWTQSSLEENVPDCFIFLYITTCFSFSMFTAAHTAEFSVDVFKSGITSVLLCDEVIRTICLQTLCFLRTLKRFQRYRQSFAKCCKALIKRFKDADTALSEKKRMADKQQVYLRNCHQICTWSSYHILCISVIKASAKFNLVNNHNVTVQYQYLC